MEYLGPHYNKYIYIVFIHIILKMYLFSNSQQDTSDDWACGELECGRDYPSHKSCVMHVRYHHGVQHVWKCQACRLMFASTRTLGVHRKNVHGIVRGRGRGRGRGRVGVFGARRRGRGGGGRAGGRSGEKKEVVKKTVKEQPNEKVGYIYLLY